MTNYSNYFNSKTTNLEIYVRVGMDTAEDKGWNYSEFYEHSRKRYINEQTGETEYAESYDQARERLRNNASVMVILKSKKENPEAKTYIITWHNGNQECGDTEDAGDVEETIKDVIFWLENDLVEKVIDLSFEAENNIYQPAFAQFDTQRT
jgi:hypothetical protein